MSEQVVNLADGTQCRRLPTARGSVVLDAWAPMDRDDEAVGKSRALRRDGEGNWWRSLPVRRAEEAIRAAFPGSVVGPFLRPWEVFREEDSDGRGTGPGGNGQADAIL